jgi:predicted alpha/beta-fold hydrolase
MLLWLACRLAPRITSLLDIPAPELPEPSPHDELSLRAADALAAFRAAPYVPRADITPYAALMAMGCRELITREADQHPDTAGRTPTYAAYPAFEEVSVPGADGVLLQGRHSTGAPGAPVILVVHGLYDSHVSLYVAEHAELLRRWGFHVFALDMRDHGRLRGRSPPPSMGLHEGCDLFEAARAISDAEGVSVGILGLSYGGQCAVRAAHEATLAGRPDVLRGGVLAISAPLDVHEAVLALDDASRLPHPRGLMQRVLVSQLRAAFDRHLQLRIGEHPSVGHPVEDYEGYIREFVLPRYPADPQLVGSFLSLARSAQPSVLGKLAVPVALLHALDDFLVPSKHLQLGLAAAGGNPWVAGRQVVRGGHIGLATMDGPGTLGILANFFGRLRDG